MAVAIRRRLHNPARRRRRRNMTAKQIKHFGTKAQRAALNRRNRAKYSAHRRRRSNPPAAPRKRRRRARRNVGEIIELALGNPARAKTRRKARRTNMAASKKRRGSSRKHRRRSNPNPYYATGSRMNRRRPSGSGRRRRRNPSYGRRRRSNPALGGITPFVTGALYAIGGGVGTRMMTQAVLGNQNQGWLGYGGNLLAAFALGAAAQMATRNRSTRNFVILGGVIATLQRVLTDMTPLGKRLALSGMGDYMVQGFLTPQRLVNGLHSAQIEYPPQVRPPVVVATNAAGEGMRGLGRRRLM